MKAFFTAAQRGQKDFGYLYQKIYSALEELGYKHVDDTIVKLNTEEFYKKFEHNEREEHINHYNKVMGFLKIADVNIFEASVASLGVGYQIEKSLDFNKPTVVLYYKDVTPHVFISGSEDEKLLVRSYTEKNLKSVLKSVLEEASTRADKRFNFFIRPNLLAYLERVSKEQGVTKSTFIRNLIIEYVREHKA